uniref:uncharacterized protein n=1 Tax=Myxine glutinosa TaxID=7769 RepID=UPI00358EB5C1
MQSIITTLVLWTTLAGLLVLQCETTPFIRVQGNSTANSQLSLMCVSETSNTTMTSWLRNGAKLWTSSRELCLLLQPPDNGVAYQCSDDNGLQSPVVTLNVTYDPKVEIHPSTSELQVPLQSAFALSCAIDANPRLRPAWYRGQNCDHHYEPRAGYSSVSWDGATLKLVLSKAEGEDEGYYCCHAPQTCDTCTARTRIVLTGSLPDWRPIIAGCVIIVLMSLMIIMAHFNTVFQICIGLYSEKWQDKTEEANVSKLQAPDIYKGTSPIIRRRSTSSVTPL